MSVSSNSSVAPFLCLSTDVSLPLSSVLASLPPIPFSLTLLPSLLPPFSFVFLSVSLFLSSAPPLSRSLFLSVSLFLSSAPPFSLLSHFRLHEPHKSHSVWRCRGDNGLNSVRTLMLNPRVADTVADPTLVSRTTAESGNRLSEYTLQLRCLPLPRRHGLPSLLHRPGKARPQEFVAAQAVGGS
eukprot:2325410-Pleurochrysis_carterae.AAC.1